MHVDLNCTTTSEYAEQIGKEIDWEETGDSNMISIEEERALQNIFTCEVSIELLRHSTGHCGSVVDDMVGIRRSFIEKYELDFNKEYTYPNLEKQS
jgi:hypothetical protein